MRDPSTSEITLVLDVVDYAEERLDDEKSDDDDSEDGVGGVEQIAPHLC